MLKWIDQLALQQLQVAGRITLRLARRIENPAYPVNVAPDFPIQVHEKNDTVTVQAGVTQRILLDYLAAHT